MSSKELVWKQVGVQDPKLILGIPKNGRGLDRIYREAKVGKYRIRQFQRLRIETEKRQDPYRNEDYWVYSGTKGLLCVVQPNRLDDFLELVKE